MPTIEERVEHLEKRVRVYRAITIVMVAIFLLILGWVIYGVWKVNTSIRERIYFPMRVSDLVFGDESEATTRASWRDQALVSASATGLVIRVAPEATQSESRSESRASVEEWKSASASLAFDAPQGIPRLSLKDRSGKEVWHAP